MKYKDKGKGDSYGKYDKGVCLSTDTIAGTSLNACQSVADAARMAKENRA